MDKRIVFDFDGVLLHSHVESMLTAFNVATGSLLTSPAGLPESFSELFSENRAAVRNAGEMVTLAEWCIRPEHTGTERLSREQLLELFPSSEVIHQKEVAFFEKRGLLYTKHPEQWLSLNSPYQPLWDELANSGLPIIIVTHKNKEAVINLSQHYGMRVAPDAIYSGDGGKSKTENFLELFEQFPAQEYYFLDDNYRNLIELKGNIDEQATLHLLYATWGYGSARDADEAAAAGLGVHTQESIVSFIKDNILL